MSVIMVHGGVETGTDPHYMKVIRDSAAAGFNALLSGGRLKAAVEAVRVLEDCPLFNAGYGSVLNRDGRVEMDASVMDGATGRFGAVAAVQDVANPVSLALAVLEKTPHVFLAGEGAREFAHSLGLPRVDCITPEMTEAWKRASSLAASRGEMSGVSLFTGLTGEESLPCDTVGCVVCSRGSLAAASSTGGSLLKLPGRVGDTPVIGGGIYASPDCAVVCTGLGEAFIETMTAKYVDSLVADGMHPQEAAEKAVSRLFEKRGATGGLLVLDSRGRWGSAHNARSFPAALMVDGSIVEDFQPRRV